MKQIIYSIFFLICSNAFGQQDSIKSSLKVSGYIEVYYGYDFGKPSDHNRPPFIYSFNRSNEVNLNLGFIKASFENTYTHANLAIMAGTYSNANLVSEQGVLKNIYETNAGVKIHKNKNIWIDAGIFGSHLGIETAVGKDSWNLTRSMAADNSPYYETGVKGTYISDNSKWLLCGLILNGWQRIQRIDGNNSLAVGHQITFTPSKKFTLNSSSFIGNTKPDSVKQMRYFHNLYATYEWNSTCGLIAGFDIGAEQKNKGSTAYNIWFTPYLQLRYKLSQKIILAARAEYYYDKNQVIISTGTINGFQTLGYSINTDVQIHTYAVWRIEAKALNSKDEIFTLHNKSSRLNYALTTSLAIAF
ncbi:porin [Cytophaga aurantiaca]|uniref:porin n=1 Tax=Cytophaga aurantiaca TaxID=29530 RepID=UPI00036C8E5B|nr:porin [Cytophaga aurantiaca]